MYYYEHLIRYVALLILYFTQCSENGRNWEEITALAFNHIPKIGIFFFFEKRVLNCNVLSILCKISPYIVYYVICQTQLETNQPLQFYDLTDFIPNEI